MKNQQNISQFEQFQISSSTLSKVSGGDKRATAKADEELE